MLDFSFACERPSGGTATVTISEVRATSLVAPAATYLRANAISGFTLSTAPSGTDYEPEFHEITYIWNVRGSPLSLELPSVLNMPTVWKDPNVAYGPEVLFAFDAAGTYDIDLFAIDRSGNYGTTTIQRVVTGADAAFPTTKTICYSETDFTGKPTGAQEVGTTTALNSAIAASTGDIRIMFRGGQTFVTDRIVCTAADSIAFTSFGTGGRATVTLLRQLYDDPNDNLFEPTPGNEIKFYDLNMAGPWDAVRERGIVAGSPVWLNRAPDTLYHRVKITGSTQVYIGFPTNAALYGLNEVEITGWQNFGVFGHADGDSGNKYVGFKACSFHQHSDAAGGFTPGDKSLQNAHGPIRLEETKHTYMGICDFFSKNGWSSAYGETQDQPCLRLNSNGVAGVHTTVDRIACENGGIIVALNEQDRTFSVSGNHVFDRMLTVSGNETSYAMTIDYAGTTLRNCLHIEPNITKTQNGVTDAIYAFKVKSGTAAAQKDSPCAIYDCSVFSPITSANNKDANAAALTNMVLAVNGYGADDAMTNFTDNNNVLHAPNQDTPATTFAPLDTTTAIAGFTPRYAGRRNSLPSYLHTLTGDVTSPSGSFTLAYSLFEDKDGNPTNQAYWTGRDAGDVMHAISVGGGVGVLYSEEGEFAVAFEASVIRITNTSGVTWTNGSTVRIKLDHSSLRPTVDTAYSLTAITMPTMRPTSGSSAIGTGDTGRKAYDDFELTVRPASGADKGAVEAT